MKRFVTLVFALFTTSVIAGISARDIQGEFNDLPETTKLEIAKQIIQAKQNTQPSLPGAAAVVASVTPEKINAWAENGKGIGIAIGSAAKELGLAADAFLKTDAGKITVAMVAWKVMGRDLVHIVGGSIFFLILAGIWTHIYRRTCLIGSVTITPIQMKILGFDVVRNKKMIIYDKKPYDAEQFFLMVVGIGIIIFSGFVIFR